MITLGGFLMALADSVPGVSGGTIAFLLGFYDDFIGSLNSLISGTKDDRIKALKFLVRLGIGWVVGFISAILVLTSVFESHIYQVSSLFMGFIVFSIPIICMEEKDSLKGKYLNLVFTLIGMGIVVLISVLSPSATGGAIVSLSVGRIVYIFIAGMIAISAMVLPGISGSTLLLIFGLYVPTITYIKEFLSLNFEGVPFLIALGLGILTGIVLVIKLIKYVLEHHRSQTIYFILGLMLGSLYSITQGATTLDTPQPAMTFSTFSIVFFIIGGVIILGLQLLKKFMDDKQSKENVSTS
jgi:putative membrane protein